MARIYIQGGSDDDVIDFEEDDIVSAGGRLMRTGVDLSRHDTVAENPNKESLGAYQETGAERAVITIVGVVTDARKDSRNTVQEKLKTFFIRDQATDDFPYGRIGFELDSQPSYNMSPTKERGAVILRMSAENMEDKEGKLYFTLVVRVLGDRNSDSPTFSWASTESD